MSEWDKVAMEENVSNGNVSPSVIRAALREKIAGVLAAHSPYVSSHRCGRDCLTDALLALIEPPPGFGDDPINRALEREAHELLDLAGLRASRLRLARALIDAEAALEAANVACSTEHHAAVDEARRIVQEGG